MRTRHDGGSSWREPRRRRHQRNTPTILSAAGPRQPKRRGETHAQNAQRAIRDGALQKERTVQSMDRSDDQNEDCAALAGVADADVDVTAAAAFDPDGLV